MNIDANGDRVLDPVVYDAVVKLHYFGGPVHKTGGARWDTYPAPPRILHAMAAQLEAALALVQAKLAAVGDD